MQETLHRLVYYSRNRINSEVLPAEIDAILAVSQRNNAASNITGALMFNAGCFGQVLEGCRMDLEAVLTRIQHDQRHSEVSLLAFEPVTARLFTRWSMGFVGHRPQDAAAFAEVGRSSGFDPAKADGDRLLKALRDLAIKDEKIRN